MDLDQIADLDPDVGLHFEFLDTERDDTLDHFTARQARRKLYFDKRAKEKIFEKDDLVLVHNSRYFNAQNREAKLKLSPPWFGPLIVHKRIHNSSSTSHKIQSKRELREDAINEDQAILEAVGGIDDPLEEYIQPIHISLLTSLTKDPHSDTAEGNKAQEDKNRERESLKPISQQRLRPLRAAAARHAIIRPRNAR
ncbi:hypothetical protein M422DRAFT_241930 [Sphaerobolus stellatus SS14]|nr:hypothetical protein M422DRAFT_241930 [Sphaerobolus stellatus SS14]